MGLEAAFIQGFAGSRSKQVKFAVNGRVSVVTGVKLDLSRQMAHFAANR
jgi:hypothetical protein